MADSFYVNFEAALSKLGQFKKAYDGSEIHRAGVIQAFEFTFEQCWKAIQKKAGTEGVTVASPKQALSWAMSLGWIEAKDEKAWLAMLSDRNLSSHTYREKTAKEVAENVLKAYEGEFARLLGKMKGAVGS
jgi:nucleotidyltransferase substrate binding protein (TIGR01987 family)